MKKQTSDDKNDFRGRSLKRVMEYLGVKKKAGELQTPTQISNGTGVNYPSTKSVLKFLVSTKQVRLWSNGNVTLVELAEPTLFPEVRT